ncbi:hypothetical protein [Nostoc sp.]|uniref:hypothetical protein n=1 Tax=Nostoc sp. TaxID=1180 RepID=UPI002FFA4F5A
METVRGVTDAPEEVVAAIATTNVKKDVTNGSPCRGEALICNPFLLKKLAMGLNFGLDFPHQMKSEQNPRLFREIGNLSLQFP